MRKDLREVIDNQDVNENDRESISKSVQDMNQNKKPMNGNPNLTKNKTPRIVNKDGTFSDPRGDGPTEGVEHTYTFFIDSKCHIFYSVFVGALSLSITKISRTCTEQSTTIDRFSHASLESLLLTKLFPSVLRLRQLLDMETVIPKICVLMLFYLSLFRFILNIFSNLSLFTFCIYFQHMVATLLQTVFLAMVFTRMTGPNNVDQRVYVSKNALITLRNGKLYLTFR